MVTDSIVLAIMVRTQAFPCNRMAVVDWRYFTVASRVSFPALAPIGVHLVDARGPVLTGVVNTLVDVCGTVSTGIAIRAVTSRKNSDVMVKRSIKISVKSEVR